MALLGGAINIGTAAGRARVGVWKKQQTQVAQDIFATAGSSEEKVDLMLAILQSLKSITVSASQEARVKEILKIIEKGEYANSQPSSEMKRKLATVVSACSKAGVTETRLIPGLFVQIYEAEITPITDANNTIEPSFPKLSFTAAQFMPYLFEDVFGIMEKRWELAMTVFGIFEKLTKVPSADAIVGMESRAMKMQIISALEKVTPAAIGLSDTDVSAIRTTDPSGVSTWASIGLFDETQNKTIAAAIMGAQAIRFTRVFQAKDIRQGQATRTQCEAVSKTFIRGLFSYMNYKMKGKTLNVVRAFVKTGREDWCIDIQAWFKLASYVQYVIGAMKLIAKVGKSSVSKDAVRNREGITIEVEDTKEEKPKAPAPAPTATPTNTKVPPKKT